MESGKEATVQLQLEATPSLLEMVTHELFILEGNISMHICINAFLQRVQLNPALRILTFFVTNAKSRGSVQNMKATEKQIYNLNHNFYSVHCFAYSGCITQDWDLISTHNCTFLRKAAGMWT